MRWVNSVRTVGAAALFASVAAPLLGADWPRFRGTAGSGASEETGLPVTWSDQDGVLWKTDLPGPGSSSPIISNGRIFVTAYSGYGVARGGGGDLKSLRRHVVCVDAKTGKLLWDRSFTSTADEAGYSGIGIPNHGYASGTPAADGERVYAFFGTAGVVAYDFEGKELWRAAVSPNPRTHNFGTGSSPVLTKDHVVVQASIECEAIVAYDKKTGAEAWRAPADGYGGWWATPVLVETGDRAELVTSVPGEVWGLNPENGKLRWHAESFSDRNVCPSAVVAGGVVYAIGGRQGGAVAVRLGGRGDVTKSHVIWTGSTGSYVPSPVLHQGHLYWVNDRGIAFCLKAETGAQIYNQRVEGGGSFYASLVVGDGKLYAVSRRNGTFVLEAKPEFRQLALNTLSDDDSNFNASPAISDGRIYLRSDRRLYAIDKGK